MRLLEKCSGCKIWWRTDEDGQRIGDSRRLDAVCRHPGRYFNSIEYLFSYPKMYGCNQNMDRPVCCWQLQCGLGLGPGSRHRLPASLLLLLTGLREVRQTALFWNIFLAFLCECKYQWPSTRCLWFLKDIGVFIIAAYLKKLHQECQRRGKHHQNLKSWSKSWANAWIW